MIFIYYHENCMDGFMSAWIAKQALGTAELRFFPYNFSDPKLETEIMPDQIYCLDCVVPEVWAYRCPVTVIDHHAGNEEKIKELAGKCEMGLTQLFDLDYCGAMLTWFHFRGRERSYIPWQVSYIDDRDRWQWKLPESREVNAALYAYPFTWIGFEKLMGLAISDAKMIGRFILALQKKQMEKDLSSRHWITLPGSNQQFLAVNSSTNQSELGNILARISGRAGFLEIGVVYSSTGNGTKCSFRSLGERSILPIVQMYGGGGHKNAGGCQSRVEVSPNQGNLGEVIDADFEIKGG